MRIPRRVARRQSAPRFPRRRRTIRSWFPKGCTPRASLSANRSEELTAALPFWGVNADPSSGCKATIGAAISAAAANDTVLVSQGMYAESVIIDKPLSLIGVDANKTIINASNLGVGIYVDGIDNPGLANVFISGFTIQNAQFEGILITNASSVTIANNVLMGNDKALTPGPT